ncbi:GlsB/YeaQ/YmgE family stress response membrane protein [Kangiella profundi]|uniref:GlsB/YeaQ/YmgE family stress response membrane protein n=2 Tax=Kangiella TaxID=261963 RepID=A0A2K9A890_9GAMM|nr:MULTISPECIES: GlsB/YeaQ/YmgE family stress response membrane protein [Kangiella]AUD78930.1 GlsB/YeaQ/YmgE family stress response membrane protein [Kangiella profundi]MBD3666922.1 GlsB/YeaQ/YmgE family stress response membrane protein [Kangiella sp.]WQG84339.1 GlsB/YeaQ/YmgE family stress response membrane protein [Kangiella aquimarina]GGF02922.1 membrane protein [Kangiella profundi]
MGFLTWIFVGLIAGILAKAIIPSARNEGIIMTIVIGIVGAILGGYVGSFFGFGEVSGFNIKTLLTATLGAVILLALQRMFAKK